ncbi:MAG TPA: sulfite exporter TauE/SafE family protein [Mycobacteriales bacterium]|nr:sulfite exporter TauE/SafE family protein [Mycobacteriales bacterium]
MEPTTLAAVGAVAVLAGVLNAVAGGGSLLLFPALLAAGLPPLAANVTNTTAIWPGYVGTALGYRTELRGQRRAVLVLSLTSLLGGATGAVLLLTTPASVFDAVVPGLVVLASLLLAVQARLTTVVQRLPGSGRGLGSPLLHVALFLAAVYGGYFGGALGVILLAVLAVFLSGDLQRVNALRSVLSLLVNTVALVAFALFGPVEWVVVAVCAPACLLGGYAGARVARRLPARALRWVIVLFGLGVGIALFFR